MIFFNKWDGKSEKRRFANVDWTMEQAEDNGYLVSAGDPKCGNIPAYNFNTPKTPKRKGDSDEPEFEGY